MALSDPPRAQKLRGAPQWEGLEQFTLRLDQKHFLPLRVPGTVLIFQYIKYLFIVPYHFDADPGMGVVHYNWNNYLCTYHLYGPVRNVFGAGRYIMWASGRNREFLGLVKWHRAFSQGPRNSRCIKGRSGT